MARKGAAIVVPGLACQKREPQITRLGTARKGAARTCEERIGPDRSGDVPGRVAQHYALQIKRSGKARSGVERHGEASVFINNG
jgi:hypothetical protein